MQNLTKYDVTFIGIRAFAIYLAFKAIGQITGVIFTFKINQPTQDGGDLFLSILIVTLVTVFMVLLPILLWKFTDKFTRIVISNNGCHEVNPREGAMNNLQAIIISSIGIFILATTFPELIRLIALFRLKYNHGFGMSYELSISMIDLVACSLKLLIGIVLTLTGSKLSSIIIRLRCIGNVGEK